MKWWWVYLLAAVPTLTEWLEVGHFPENPRAAITDFCLTTVLLACAMFIIRQARRLERTARTDPLTGLNNSRKLQEDLPDEVARSRRLKSPLSLAYADLDNFKKINDQSGHKAGDDTLRRFGDLLLKTARRTDRCYRIGGDEFVIVMPGANSKGAADLLDRIRASSRQEPVALERHGAGVSVGVVELRNGETSEDLIRRADHQMYQSKNGGKDKVTAM
jgi:diguanylate cyclase (GGDEF)-like protein